MALLLVTILFNAYISIIFKYFEKYEIRVLQGIVLNYFICVLTASVVLQRPAVTAEILDKEWLGAAIAIGLSLILVFNTFAQTVQRFGVVFGAIFQKMSLIAPALVAIIFFNESAGWMKILGIVLAIAAIFVISFSKSSNSEEEATEKAIPRWMWIFPFATFIGSCFIDTSFFYVNEIGLASSVDIDFVASLFFFAGCFGILLVAYEFFVKGIGYRWKDVVAGIMLGVPNFFSIYLIFKVLANGMEGSVVFPINNVGILVASAILGILLFKEKFNLQKIIGFVMAVLAIVLIANG